MSTTESTLPPSDPPTISDPDPGTQLPPAPASALEPEPAPSSSARQSISSKATKSTWKEGADDSDSSSDESSDGEGDGGRGGRRGGRGGRGNLMSRLDLSSRDDPPSLQTKSLPAPRFRTSNSKSNFKKPPSSSASSTSGTNGANKTLVNRPLVPISGSGGGSGWSDWGGGGGGGNGGKKAIKYKGEGSNANHNTTGTKKTSIQQKISAFTIKKPPSSISSGQSTIPSSYSSSNPKTSSSSAIFGGQKSVTNGGGQGGSGWGGAGGRGGAAQARGKEGEKIAFGMLPNLKQSNAASYPIIQGIERQKLLPTKPQEPAPPQPKPIEISSRQIDENLTRGNFVWDDSKQDQVGTKGNNRNISNVGQQQSTRITIPINRSTSKFFSTTKLRLPTSAPSFRPPVIALPTAECTSTEGLMSGTEKLQRFRMNDQEMEMPVQEGGIIRGGFIDEAEDEEVQAVDASGRNIAQERDDIAGVIDLVDSPVEQAFAGQEDISDNLMQTNTTFVLEEDLDFGKKPGSVIDIDMDAPITFPSQTVYNFANTNHQQLEQDIWTQTPSSGTQIENAIEVGAQQSQALLRNSVEAMPPPQEQAMIALDGFDQSGGYGQVDTMVSNELEMQEADSYGGVEPVWADEQQSQGSYQAAGYAVVDPTQSYHGEDYQQQYSAYGGGGMQDQGYLNPRSTQRAYRASPAPSHTSSYTNLSTRKTIPMKRTSSHLPDIYIAPTQPKPVSLPISRGVPSFVPPIISAKRAFDMASAKAKEEAEARRELAEIQGRRFEGREARYDDRYDDARYDRDDQEWSTLPSPKRARKNLDHARPVTKKISTKFTLPGRMFKKESPEPQSYLPSNANRSARRTSRFEDDEIEIVPARRKITLFKPSSAYTKQDNDQPERHSEVPSRKHRDLSVELAPAPEVDHEQDEREEDGHSRFFGNKPGATTPITKLLLNPDYNDPLAPACKSYQVRKVDVEGIFRGYPAARARIGEDNSDALSQESLKGYLPYLAEMLQRE